MGETLKPIVESTLGTDLAEPCRLKDLSFIKPGKASWSWPLLKDFGTVYDVQKMMLDFAAQLNWQYCLIDAEWDHQIGYDRIAELASYAKTKGIGIFLWYNSAGSWNRTTQTPRDKLLTRESRRKEFARLKNMGIVGIKADFFAGDGQSMFNYYKDILEDAADFGLMVNCHGASLLRGLQRTYPNLITVEAVKGFENVVSDQYNADGQPFICSVLPFTRNLFDPRDYTPTCFQELPSVKRRTSNAFELALSVLFQSGIQHFVELPADLASVPPYVKAFLKDVPANWEDICCIDGYPGQYVILARKANGFCYVAGINALKTELRLELRLPFIQKETKAWLITDGETNREFIQQELQLKPDSLIALILAGYGGFIIKLPA